MHKELFNRILSSIILLPLVLAIVVMGSYFFNIFLLFLFFISAYEWHLMSKKKLYYYLGFIFLIISFFFAFKLRHNTNTEYFSFLLVMVICILTDIGGYVFGKIFKGPKLTNYSPNKTYAGVIGSYAFSITLVPVLLTLGIVTHKDTFILIFFIFLVSSVSQLGDICISYFKRISKIKDTGKIIPGHGGLLDRIDGMIFAYPFSYLIMLISFFKII